jgi:hypothetical protein
MQKSQSRKKASRPARENDEQSRLFMEKAREIEADEERSRADELLGELAKLPPEPRKKPARK